VILGRAVIISLEGTSGIHDLELLVPLQEHCLIVHGLSSIKHRFGLVSVLGQARGFVDSNLPDLRILPPLSFTLFTLKGSSAEDEGSYLLQGFNAPHVNITIKAASGNDIKLRDKGHLVDEVLMGLPSVDSGNIILAELNMAVVIIEASQESSLLRHHLLSIRSLRFAFSRFGRFQFI